MIETAEGLTALGVTLLTVGCNGPAYDLNHRDHFHLDMKERKGAGICH